MRTITIIGAGQGGLCLAFGLLQDGHNVRLISGRSASDIEGGPVTSSQSMYETANGIEKSLGLNFWDDECPVFNEFEVRVADSAGTVFGAFRGKLTVPGQAIDQRVKHARWLRHFEAQGGALTLHEATVDDAERYAKESDLVVVASGKGALSRLFRRDPARSHFEAPPHNLALTYVKRIPDLDSRSLLAAGINPGVGKFSVFPGLTRSGPCDIITVASEAGGPIDQWDSMKTPEDHLAFTQYCFETHFPLEAARLGKLELTDPRGVARARFLPEVRRPVAALPSGAKVLGLGDALTLCDPMGGQGANIATFQAARLRDAIRERGDRPLDEEFMVDHFERHWKSAQWNVRYSNLLAGPPAPWVGLLFDAANRDEGLGRMLANSLDLPSSVAPWFFVPAEAFRFLASRGHEIPPMPA